MTSMTSMKKKLKTLKVKFPVISFFTYLTLVIVILSICYGRFHRNTLESYKAMGEEILNLAGSEIRADHIPAYLEGECLEEYQDTSKRLNEYISYCKEIYFLYAYKIEDNGKATVLFDADTKENGKGDELGAEYKLEPDILAQLPIIREGGQIEPLVDDTDWGYLITCSKPLYDSNGVCQAYIFLDFNMTDIIQSNNGFIMRLFLVAFLVMLGILYLGMKAVSVRITTPIEKIYLCLKGFKFGTDEAKKDNIKALKELDIHTNIEIQSLYETLVNTMAQTLQLEEQVYVDILTGVGNKFAYEEKVKGYQQQIDKYTMKELAVIVADINNLKYVNDTFGHAKGDNYIKGCCKILVEIFGKQNIYRIGGDEFTIFIDGDAFTSRYLNVQKAEDAFAACIGDNTIKEYKRYNASIGIEDMTNEDKNIIDVIKRADKKMYENKQRFKEKYGSYR